MLPPTDKTPQNPSGVPAADAREHVSPVCRIHAARADQVEWRELVATLPPDRADHPTRRIPRVQQWMDSRIACWQACPAPVPLALMSGDRP